LPEHTNNKNLANNDFQEPHVVAIFALVGMAITGIMGLVGLFNQNFFLAGALFLASFVYFNGYYAYKKFNNIKLASAIILYSLYLLMLYLVYTGGVEKTGPLWIFMVAPVSVFIHGLKRGLFEIALFLILTSVILFVPLDLFDNVSYSTEFKLRLIYSFLTVTFLSAVYEYTREKSYKRALDLSKKYQQLAHLDHLTQLSNRRDALHILKREKARIIRSKEAFSIMLCDVDHFKKINDLYGHNAGDAVLIDLAKIFTRTIREQDCVARWGGEEFLFILPQTLVNNANIIAMKIQEELQNHFVNYEDEKIKVTVSIGIEQFNANQSIDEVINNADKFLYQAKDSGRNQIFPKF